MTITDQLLANAAANATHSLSYAAAIALCLGAPSSEHFTGAVNTRSSPVLFEAHTDGTKGTLAPNFRRSFQAKTSFVKRLVALREKAIANGMVLLSAQEIEAEVASLRRTF